MVATRINSGVYREVWQELVPLDGGASETIQTNITLLRATELGKVFGILELVGIVGTPGLVVTTAAVFTAANLWKLSVTVTNGAAPGNTATFILDTWYIHSLQQGADTAAVSQIHVVSAASAAAPLGNTVVPEQVNALASNAGISTSVSRADHTHGTQPWVGETITVAKSGGQFTTIAAALASIVPPASAAIPWRIIVEAGDYTEAPFTIPEYVKIEGAGWLNTILRTTTDAFNFITMSPASVLRNVGIYGPANFGQACIYHAPVNDPRPAGLTETSIFKGYYGVYSAPTGVPALASPMLIDVLSFAYSGFNIQSLIRGEQNANMQVAFGLASGPANSIVEAFSFWGPNVQGLLTSCQHQCSTGDGVLADNSASVRIFNSRFITGVNALHVGSTGASRLRCIGTMIQQLTGGYTRHIYIESALATMSFNGSADRGHVFNTGGGSLVATFLDVETAGTGPGSTVLGELNAGTSATNLTPYVSYGNATFLTGLVTGGVVTRGAGRVLNISAGSGYINDGSVTNLITWGNTSVTLAVSSTEYVYIDSAGAPQHSVIQPPYATSIVLAQAVSGAANIIVLTQDEITISHQASRLQEYLEDVVGPINVSGVATALATMGPPITRFDVSGGEFMVGLSERDVPAPLAAPAFYYWYRTGAAWTSVASTDINSAQYNDPATGLQALVGWKKDLVIVTVGGDGPEVHVVYGQEVFGNQPAAEAGAIPQAPDILTHYGQRSGGLVIQGGPANPITSITDVRPRLGQLAATTVTAGDHDLLLNLANDTHLQYFGSGVGAPSVRSAAWLAAQPGNNVNLVTGGNLHDHTAGAGAQIDHDDLLNNGGAGSHVALTAHLIDVANPHATTYTQVGAPPDTRNLTAGAGLTGGGNLTADRTFNVVANADGSIIANADDIQVGILATDAQHGVRGGGTQHAAVVAGVSNGFMTAADKTKIDASGILSAVAPANVTKAAADPGAAGEASRRDHKHDISTAAPGATGVATIAADGVAATLARSDHAHLSNTAASTIGTANTVGASGEPARADHVHDHGAQALGAGTQHAAATTAVNGFMAATDKLKLDRMRSVRLAAPQTNNTATWADVAGLSFAVAANTTYRFVFDIIFQSTATGIGIGFGVNGPAAPTSVVAIAHITQTLSGNVPMYSTRAYSTGAGTGQTSASIDTANVDSPAYVEGVFVNGANAGTLSLAFRSEAATAVSVRTGSVGIIQEIA